MTTHQNTLEKLLRLQRIALRALLIICAINFVCSTLNLYYTFARIHQIQELERKLAAREKGNR